MTRLIQFLALSLLTIGLLPLHPQDRRTPQEVLNHALHLADLYNWDDAASDFAEAEKMFLALGDQRNALYASSASSARPPISEASRLLQPNSLMNCTAIPCYKRTRTSASSASS
jgi:hypothetical protein